MNRARRTFLVLTAGAVAISMVSAVSAAEWGSLKGRFVVDGTPPTPEPLVVTKDQYCIDKKPISESVVVGDDGSLANALVYLRLGRREKVDVHPDYAAKLSEAVELDNKGCHFVPHVTLVRVGQQLIIKNTDPVGHNTKTSLVKNANFNQTIAAGSELPFQFDRAEAIPAPVECSIHPFMRGYLLVQDHPYMAVSAEDGTFEIKDIPAGKREFQFWHETGYLRGLKVDSGVTDRRGGLELTIKAAQTLDLGEIKVRAASLETGR